MSKRVFQLLDVLRERILNDAFRGTCVVLLVREAPPLSYVKVLNWFAVGNTQVREHLVYLGRNMFDAYNMQTIRMNAVGPIYVFPIN